MEIDLNKCELKWQQIWDETQAFAPSNKSNKPKYFNFDSAPFPNGNLHIGHARNYILGDIFARYKRLRGFNVLYCTNFDAFGLPNQLEAEKRGLKPEDYTNECIAKITNDLKRLGISYDWQKVNSTCDPRYYKNTQWIFLKLYSAGLVYRKKALVNWCNNCSTVLSNLEVDGDTCSRCDSKVTLKESPQWFIKLSAYSEKLYNSIDNLDNWSQTAKKLVKGFIGKKSGRLVNFKILGSNKSIDVFIKNGHKINDVTFVATTINSALLNNLNKKTIHNTNEINGATPAKRKNSKYIGRNAFDSGIILEHPTLKTAIPLLCVNYLSDNEGPPVLAGTPASNKADLILAKKISLKTINLDSDTAEQNLIPENPKNYYHVHDWMVSRQKTWGTPIPIIICEQCGFVPAKETQLPISVNTNTCSEPTKTTCPTCSQDAVFSKDTLDCYIDDAWCFLSHDLPKDNDFILDKYNSPWYPTDHYHAGYDIHMYLHLYRFMATFLYEQGHINHSEPIQTYHGHDMVLHENRKMSKHYNNSITITDLIKNNSADTIRIAIMLESNPKKTMIWRSSSTIRAKKILNKIINIASFLLTSTICDCERKIPNKNILSLTKKEFTLKKSIENYLEAYLISTCIQHIETHIKDIYKITTSLNKSCLNIEDHNLIKKHCSSLCIFLSPFAPHLSEEIWHLLENKKSLTQDTWPE